MTDPKTYFFSEVGAGGFTRVDGTVEFYNRVNALIRQDDTVLDFGAGRGAALQEDRVRWRKGLRQLRGKCRRVIGVDIDDAVLGNPGLDEAVVITGSGVIPLSDAQVDIIVSDWVFEHIAEPEKVCRELDRVLKPGGWLCARTPNRCGYIALGARVVPSRWESRVLKVLQPAKRESDTFPTFYRLNSPRAIKRYFPPSRYEHYTYGYFAEPAYCGSSKFLWRVMLLSFKLSPQFLAPTWLIFLRKVR